MTRWELRAELIGLVDQTIGFEPTVDVIAEIDRIVEQLFADGLDPQPTDPRQQITEIAGQAAVRERAADGAIVLADNDSGMWLR